jgi:hypothetical protein
MPVITKQPTRIEWISVHDELPKEEISVLALEENSDHPVSAIFYNDSGWKVSTVSPKRFELGMKNEIPKIKFWSKYNLPK